MKLRSLFVVGMLISLAAAVQAADKPILAGNWMTPAVRTAIKAVKTGTTKQKLIDAAGGVAGGVAGSSMPGGGRSGGRGGPSPVGRVKIDTSATKVVDQGSSPDGKALLLNLKVSKTKLTGQLTHYVTDDKFVIEAGVVNGTKFKFNTYRKVSSMRIETRYEGEVVGPDSIKLVRTTIVGDPIDKLPDGSAETLVFERGK